jgi:UDP-N-acetylmuramoyl-tripeptide--D-alanyl-D-alanine ligase
MRELGATSPQLHADAGKFAAKTGKIDWVVGVEGDATQIVEGAVSAGLARSQTKVFASSEEAAKFLADFVAPGDLLLVKGSRGVKMERIVETLLAVHAPELAGTEKVRH